MTLLSLDAVTRTLGTRTVLDHLELQVDDGMHTAIAGRSGAGKTTLLRLVLGLDRPDEGEVRVTGREVTGPSRRLGWLRETVQLVAQDATGSLDPRHAVRRSVAEPLVCRGPRRPARDEVERRVTEAVDLVQLPTDVLDRQPGELSGGQRQRVALARALVVRPRLLVADEPFSGLDPATRLDLCETLGRVLTESDTTLLLVSHDPGTAALLCPRRLQLIDGRLGREVVGA